MKILLLDIETAPNTAYVWGLFDQNISHEHLVETSYMLCWSAMWFGKHKHAPVHFASCHEGPKKDPVGYKAMLQKLYDLLNEADVVVHYYGSKFDIPKTFKEFVQLGWPPPSPFKQVDLKIVVQKVFKFESNKLDHVCEMLFQTNKIETKFQLWVDCMANDAQAWAHMEKYNKHDVKLLRRLYVHLLPWIEKHPSWSAFSGCLVCPKCGSRHTHSRGTTRTRVATYQQRQCQDCGGWFRSNKRCDKGGERGVNISS